MNIPLASCNISKRESSGKEKTRLKLLQGQIEGLETSFTALSKGVTQAFRAVGKKLKIILVTRGTGFIRQGELRLEVEELDLFIPFWQGEYVVRGGNKGLAFLELNLSLNRLDLEDLEGREYMFPFHGSYSESKSYTESIKSGKSVNRMILPEGVVPRLCMGSVRSMGPDLVEAHAHPMLEQLFFGLKGNESVVSAGTAVSSFRENELLYIPSGSLHGVQVEKDKSMHYLWIDLFHSLKDMGYMRQQHQIPVNKPK